MAATWKPTRFVVLGALGGLFISAGACFIHIATQCFPTELMGSFFGALLGAVWGGVIALFARPRTERLLDAGEEAAQALGSRPSMAFYVMCAVCRALLGAISFFMAPCVLFFGGNLCGLVGFLLAPVSAIVGVFGGIAYVQR